MAYSSKAVFLPEAAMLVAESLGQEAGRDAESQTEPRLRHGRLIRAARYDLIRPLRVGAIEAEAEHMIPSKDGFQRIEIRKVSRVWWAQAIVEPPHHVDLWKPGCVYIDWSGKGGLVIGPWGSPPPAGYVIDGATAVRRISLELEALLALWPIAALSRGMLATECEKQINSETSGAPATADDPAGTRDRQTSGETPTAPRRRPGPSPTVDRIKEAGQTLIDEGHVPSETVPWERFGVMLCRKLGIGPKTRGYSLDSIQKAMRPLLQKRQAAKLFSENTESTESTES